MNEDHGTHIKAAMDYIMGGHAVTLTPAGEYGVWQVQNSWGAYDDELAAAVEAKQTVWEQIMGFVASAAATADPGQLTFEF